MPESPAAAMRLVGGDPGIDFVNTVSGRPTGANVGATAPDDKLRDYADLVAWAGHAGLVGEAAARQLQRAAGDRPSEAARVLQRAIDAREALYRVLRALVARRRPAAKDLAALNRELGPPRARERLVAGPQGLRWAPGAVQDPLEQVLAPIWRAVSALLTSGDLSRLRRCAGGGCGWLFLDRSRNRSRQWCTMEDCGNLAKVRRFRQRQKRQAPARG